MVIALMSENTDDKIPIIILLLVQIVFSILRFIYFFFLSLAYISTDITHLSDRLGIGAVGKSQVEMVEAWNPVFF